MYIIKIQNTVNLCAELKGHRCSHEAICTRTNKCTGSMEHTVRSFCSETFHGHTDIRICRFQDKFSGWGSCMISCSDMHGLQSGD